MLVDANLRQPVLHQMFEVAGETGLADLLTAPEGRGQPESWRALVRGAIQPVGPACAGLIAAGSELASASGLLRSDRMKVLLETVAQGVDYVIIDSPPLSAGADALMLSTQVDGVVLVARAGSLPRRQLEQALRQLKELDARVVGVVLNRVKARTNGSAYGARPG